jgi:hypothetical protein
MKQDLDLYEIFPVIERISDSSYRNYVTDIWQTLWHSSEWNNIYDLPVSPKIRNSHVVHNRSVVAMALDVAEAFETFHGVHINRDLLITAGLLQDAGKLMEFRPTPNGEVEYTEIGRMYPHGFWGAQLAASRGVPTEICHIMLDHTPDSARFPQSLEGKVLYYVDQVDMLCISGDRWKKETHITIHK